jgi:DNA-binding response OmpR family regulator
MKSSDDNNLSNKRVMVVDDDELITRLFGIQLPKLGFETILFNDSRQALSFFDINHASIDVSVIDLEKPYYVGIGLVRKMQQVAPDVRVLFLTGLGNDDIDNLDGFRVLHKPIWSYELADAINNLIDSRIPISHKRVAV